MAESYGILRVLKTYKLITPEQEQNVIAESKKEGKPIISTIVDLKLVPSEKIREILVKEYAYPYLNLDDIDVKEIPSAYMDKNLIIQHHALPVYAQGKTLFLAMSDPTNTARMRRQRVYLDGLYTQLSEKLHTVDGFALRLASRLADFGESDITTDEMAALAERLKDFRFNKIYTIAGEARRGEEFMEFYADEDALLAQIIELFYEPLPEK